VKKIERSPTVWAEWIQLKETLIKFQVERSKETSDDKGSDDIKAERKRKSDASPVDFATEAWLEVKYEICCLEVKYGILTPIC